LATFSSSSFLRQRLRSSGLTLVELLVVLAVIGTLVALLLPAIQAGREAGRRAQCLSNLRQIGVGLHSYHDLHQLLPRGGAGVASLTNPNVQPSLSWGAAILPGLEQNALYESIHQDESYLHEDNLQAGQTILAIFLCPTAAHGDARRPNGDTPGSMIKYAINDYGANWGERALRCYPATNCQNSYDEDTGHAKHGRGVMLLGMEPQLSLKDITDGTSHTIAVGEAPEALHGIWIGHKNVFDQSAPISAHTSKVSAWQSCWPSLGSKVGNFCDFGQEFHSYHTGGAQFLLVDGSARFISSSLENKLLAALLSSSGDEAIGDF
jgi:prepilin-type N-terminal cleavage/methylation domain-containing protein